MNKKLIFTVMTPAMSLLLFSSNSFAESANTDFNIKVNPSLSLSVSSSNVGFSLTPTQAGSYDSASFNIYSSTNNPTGYKLIMSTNKIDLESNTVNPTTGTKPTIPTLAETQEGISAAAFEASTSSDVLNHYGVSVAGSNYNALKSTKNIKTTITNNVEEDTTTISLASKINLLTVPGVYSTTLNFELVANIYTEGGSINDNSEKYPANSLLRAFEIAYTNAGKPMYIEDSNTDIGWRPMVAADYDTVGGKEVRFAIQDISMTFEENGQTKNVCEWAAPSTIDTTTNPWYPVNTYLDTALVMDLRDGTSYNIIKAADGRCWMQDNLMLDPTLSDVQSRLSSDNTNASEEAISNYINGGNSGGNAGWTSSFVTAKATGAKATSFTSPYIVADNKETVATDSLTQDGGWKTGVYYNYCAASIGTYCYEGSQYYDKPDTYLDVEQDICPSGWRMPTGTYVWGGNSGETTALTTAYPNERTDGLYDNSTPIRIALHLPFEGNYAFDGGYIYMPGSDGYFWTASRYESSSNYMWSFLVQWSTPSSGSTSYRTLGLPVRCIAK